MQRIRANLATAIYDNKLSDCLLSRSQRWIGLFLNAFVTKSIYLHYLTCNSSLYIQQTSKLLQNKILLHKVK